jgi:hypothetical protein
MASIVAMRELRWAKIKNRAELMPHYLATGLQLANLLSDRERCLEHVKNGFLELDGIKE